MKSLKRRMFQISVVFGAMLSILFSAFSPCDLWGQRAANPQGHDWMQFNFDPQHSGFNNRETVLGPENVTKLRLLFRVKLPAVADGAPAFLSGVQTPAGKKELLFLTTTAGHLLALDGGTGDVIWEKENPAGSCRINNGSHPCYTTSSPAVDPDRKYVYSYGLDGRAHKYRVGDGEEILADSWPQMATLKPFDEKGSSALTIAKTKEGSFLYVAHSGYLGDRGDYQGHVTAIDLSNGRQKVFNANCSDLAEHFRAKPAKPDCPGLRSGIWARAGIIYVQGLEKIFLATGNGSFNPSNHDWGDSVLALNPDGAGRGGNPLDSYTPHDFRSLEDEDLDLGSTAPAFLPAAPDAALPYVGVQGGKDGKLRLLNLQNLSGRNGPGNVGGELGKVIDIPQGGMLLTAPAVWINPADRSTWTFVANREGISGLRVRIESRRVPALEVRWKQSYGGTSPVIANSVLYYASSHHIRALDPLTGKQLWENKEIGGIHWQSPIVINGVLYITDEDKNLSAFSVPP